MKRGLLLSLMAMVSLAQAVDVTFDGQVRYRVENVSSPGFDADIDSYNFAKLRTQLGANVTPQEGLNIFIQAQDHRTIGDPSLGTSATTTNDTNLGLHQAYFTWDCKALAGLTIKAGRFEYIKADQRFFSNADWGPARVMEGWALLYKTPFADVDLFGVKAYEAMAAKQDVTDLGLYFGNILGKRVDVFYNVLDFGENPVTEDKDSFSTIGVHYDNTYFDKLGVNFNYAMQTGSDENTDTDYKGMMYGLDASYRLDLPFLGKVGFGYESTSADDTGEYGWQELFASGHKFWGLQDIVTPGPAGLNDLQINFAGGLPLGLGYKLDYHMFSYVEDTGLEGNTDLGSEIDLSLVKKMDNFGVNLGWSSFTPTDNYASDGDPQGWMYLQFTAGF